MNENYPNWNLEYSIQVLWDNFIQSNECLNGIPKGEGRKREQGKKKYEAVITMNFSKLVTDIKLQIQETYRNIKYNRHL